MVQRIQAGQVASTNGHVLQFQEDGGVFQNVVSPFTAPSAGTVRQVGSGTGTGELSID